ncbi:hypothetical protein ACC696_38245, partial [Rhizobium ruizarguesonis]
MLLGNAILRVARLDHSVCSTAAAKVTLDGIELDCEHCERSLLANFETVSVFKGEPSAIFAIKLDAVQSDFRSRRAANRLIQPGD